jgi:hypothetical protein
MKFSKFVKSLAPAGGAIYEYMDERWLASPSVLMLIPDGIRSVTGYSNEKMPDGIGRLISQVGCTEYAKYPDDEDQLVGIIFPYEYAEQLNFHTIKEV